MPALRTRRFATRAALEAALTERLAAAIGAPAGGAIMLSGGSTPLPAYRALGARPPAPAAGLAVLFSDDRYVPADSPASNYCQSRPLLDALRLPEARLLRVRTELPLVEAAADYEQRLDELLGAGVRIGLGLLGLGAEGHTASLFSAADLERARGHRAIPVQRPDGVGRWGHCARRPDKRRRCADGRPGEVVQEPPRGTTDASDFAIAEPVGANRRGGVGPASPRGGPAGHADALTLPP